MFITNQLYKRQLKYKNIFNDVEWKIVKIIAWY
jgi:hypothetical protein